MLTTAVKEDLTACQLMTRLSVNENLNLGLLVTKLLYGFRNFKNIVHKSYGLSTGEKQKNHKGLE